VLSRARLRPRGPNLTSFFPLLTRRQRAPAARAARAARAAAAPPLVRRRDGGRAAEAAELRRRRRGGRRGGRRAAGAALGLVQHGLAEAAERAGVGHGGGAGRGGAAGGGGRAVGRRAAAPLARRHRGHVADATPAPRRLPPSDGASARAVAPPATPGPPAPLRGPWVPLLAATSLPAGAQPPSVPRIPRRKATMYAGYLPSLAAAHPRSPPAP
jgi:hypothetical protein